MTSRFSFNVNSFKGDPATFQFFEEQVKSYIKLNKLSDEESLIFVRSKLEGPAFTYYIESPILQALNSHSDLLRNLKLFFNKTGQHNYASEFETLSLLPGENLRSLAHRINKLTKLVYPNIQDEEALQQIQLEKFIRLLPASIKIKVIDLKPKSFDDAVDKSENLLQQYAQHNVLNLLTSTPNSENSEQLRTLSAEVNFLKQSASNSANSSNTNTQDKRQYNNNRSKNNQQNRKALHPKTTQYHNNRQRYNRDSRVKCQFCNKYGHDLKTCRSFFFRFGPKGQNASVQQPQQFGAASTSSNFPPQGHFENAPPFQMPRDFSHPPPPPPRSSQSGHPNGWWGAV